MSVSINSSGVLIPIKGVGKDNKFLPWSMVKKETVAPAVKHCTNEKYGLDMYLVEKTVNGNRLEAVFETKREAFKAVDIHLIKNGKEPELILKKA
tara:strand:+ start:421 stop:705 length:285 start_codon:yes stop_codon:yes gene_type:complete